MATHSSILDWRIPWTEKPSRLQSVGVTKSRQEKELCEGLCGTCQFLLVRRVGWVEAAVAVGRVGNGRGCCDEAKDAVKGAGSHGGS